MRYFARSISQIAGSKQHLDALKSSAGIAAWVVSGRVLTQRGKGKLSPNLLNLARNLSKKARREIKARKLAASIVVTSDNHLRSILGLMLRRLWLYSNAAPIAAYQLDSDIAFARPLYTEREGFTQYYR